jgi:acylglycerol lipase
VYVLGHSVGGVIASSYVFEHQPEVAGLICESFAFDVGLPHLVQLALEGTSYLVPHLPVYSLKNEIFSRNPDVVAEMNNDPLIANEKQPAETVSEVLKAAARLGKNMPKFNVPVFIIHGTDDKATRPEGSQYFYDNVGSEDKTLKLYEGGYHDLLNDIDKEIVMADILAWVNERIPAESAATAAV